MTRRACPVALVLAVLGCRGAEPSRPPVEARPEPAPSPPPSEPPPAAAPSPAPAPAPLPATGPVPVDAGPLFTYLQARGYQTFAARESGRHGSRGPHSRRGQPVRVFLDDRLAASLAAGADAHPVGASAVKELYSDAGVLRGWAVMVKVAAASGDGGEGWYWYEVLSAEDGSSPVAAGTGVALCADCHGAGRDQILTRFPLE